METPQYVLKMNEAAIMPGPKSKAIRIYRTTVIVLVAIMVLYCLVFQENILSELSWSTKALLFCIIAGAFTVGGKKVDTPSPMEIQFYRDYLIVYRPKRYYNPKVTRQEFNLMYYTDITRCKLDTSLQRLTLYGTVNATWYNFLKDGSLPSEPSYNRVVPDTICWVRTIFATELDIKSEIEAHSPIQVTIET